MTGREPMGPCKDLEKEYIEAMNDWVNAANALQSFAATGPLEPDEEPNRLPVDEFRDAFEKEKKAQKNYRAKMEEYFDCRQRHPKQS